MCRVHCTGLDVCCASQAAGYDVVTMDTETGRKATRDALAEAAREAGREPAVVQGNFDPRLLTDDSSMSEVNVSVLCCAVLCPRECLPRVWHWI